MISSMVTRNSEDHDHVGAARQSAHRGPPALSRRPIVSATMTRWCDAAVVYSRSIDSATMLMAVSKPMQ